MTKTDSTGKKRKPISKRIRFEVFKRDCFTCQYCGRKSPDVILHVDHIKPVSKGGTNGITNLITSCSVCNLGKGARELSDASVVEKQRAELELQQERINQIELMAKWQLSLINVDEKSVDVCCDVIRAMSGSTLNDSGKILFKKHIRKFSLPVILESIRASFDQYDDIEKALKMVPKIADIKSLPEWKQVAIRFSCYAKKNGFQHSDRSLFKNIVDNHSVEDLDFEDIYESGMNLRQYCEAIMKCAGLSYTEEAE